ncbi:hypothetical protein ACLMJK_007025 [Lecanora helva]
MVISPSPISWQPSESWDGDDGAWSSFFLRVGTPGQAVRVLPSTAGSVTWAVIPEGCQPQSLACSDARGGLFNVNESSSWNELGIYTLGLEQNFAGHNESGLYGLDTIGLGASNATNGPVLDSQVVVGIETNHYRTGIFGLNNQPQNITNITNTYTSFLTSLRTKNLIPSLSWAYTAGAPYRSKGFFGSLIFGGSDLSRYTPSNISFNLAPDIQRDLVVGVQTIVAAYDNGTSQPLLSSSSPFLAYIDSTVPYLYLPTQACEMFEMVLGLQWNSALNFYPISEELHQDLLKDNPTFKFSIGNNGTSIPVVEITLPYASFDLTGKPPLFPNTTTYFPLRRAANESQFTLGRTFLQEAYLATNYEFKNFSISQAHFADGALPNIQALPSNDTTHHPNRGEKGTTTIIGSSIGAALFVAFLLIGASFLIYRKRRKTDDTDNAEPLDLQLTPRPESLKISPQEIGQPSLHGVPRELEDSGRVELLDQNVSFGSGDVVNEVSQPAPQSTFAGTPPQNRNPMPEEQALNPRSTAVSTTFTRVDVVRNSKIAHKAHSNRRRTTKPRPSAVQKSKPLPPIPISRSISIPSSPVRERATVPPIASIQNFQHNETSEKKRKYASLTHSASPSPISVNTQASPVLSKYNQFYAPRKRHLGNLNSVSSVRSTYALFIDFDEYDYDSSDGGIALDPE